MGILAYVTIMCLGNGTNFECFFLKLFIYVQVLEIHRIILNCVTDTWVSGLFYVFK